MFNNEHHCAFMDNHKWDKYLECFVEIEFGSATFPLNLVLNCLTLLRNLFLAD